ncbi:ParA family protein [Vibrio splendidus]
MDSKQSKTIAVVSGKGGSGKTMLTATMAKVLDESGFSVLLIDADFGTAGLTYYLGLNEVSNISVGLTNLFSNVEKTSLTYDKVIEPLSSYSNTDFIGVGDHRRYKKNGESDFFHEYFDAFINKINEEKKYDYIIVDCRGGIDEESLTVCKSASDIIIVAETDTTSFQATQFLVDTLYDNGVSDKLTGFFVNKVFDDPSILIRNGVVSFKTTCLSSIPFDLDSIKSFIVGEVPKLNSIYTNQIWHGLFNAKVFSGINKPKLNMLQTNQFSIFSFKDRSTTLGSYLISSLLFLLLSTTLFGLLVQTDAELNTLILLGISAILSVASVSDGIKKSLGRSLSRLSLVFSRNK